MFRTLGLRHLCVINRHHQVLGIVTRADLVAAHGIGVDDPKVFVRSNEESTEEEKEEVEAAAAEQRPASPDEGIELMARQRQDQSPLPSSPAFDYNYPNNDTYRNANMATRRRSETHI